MPIPGVDTFIIDDTSVGVPSTDTDTLFLLSPAGPATPVAEKRPDTADQTLNAEIRAYFNDGGKSLYVQGYGDGTALPLITDAVDLLPAGPGQVVAPEIVTDTEAISIIEAAWAQNKVTLVNGPGNADDAALEELAAAIIAGTDARGAGLFADVATVPGEGTATVNIPWSVIVAALIARVDRATGNPNLAAAGARGISNALGITAPHSEAAIAALKDAQVNCAKIVNGQLRNYGFRTLADLNTLPTWWDLSGSRTVMKYRALVTAGAEEFVFDQIDGEGQLLGRYESMLRDQANSLWKLGALYGATPDDAYRVEVSDDPEQLAAGELEGTTYLRTSPYVEHAITNITRRSIVTTV